MHPLQGNLDGGVAMRRYVAAIVLAVASLLSFSANAQSPDIRDIIRSELACALIDSVFADMPVAPLYSVTDNGCEAVRPDSAEVDYFSDDSCSGLVNFAPTDRVDHCALLLDSTGLGEGGDIGDNTWTLSPGSRFDLGALSLEDVQQPYMQSTIYRRINTDVGECELEMRVYASHPAVENQKPLIAFHGGSWSGRGFGFFGLELTIPHYVEQGFVVFAPFYRLLGDSEGSAACHNATIGDIVDDANAALEWVQREAGQFGASGNPVTFGQSAGAHLAASLAVYSADQISGAVLMYPPTDFTDFALRAISGAYDNEQGLGILRRVMQLDDDADLSLIDLSASPVPENSFPQRIVEDGITPAPMFMIHGLEDDLVEARQSVRLCDALAGRELTPLDSPAVSITRLREMQSCNEASSLQLIRQGQHALDVCLVDTLIPTDLCFSGSEASRLEVADAISNASEFAIEVANRDAQATPELPSNDDASDDGSDDVLADDSGGGALSGLAFLLWWFVVLRVNRGLRDPHGQFIQRRY